MDTFFFCALYIFYFLATAHLLSLLLDVSYVPPVSGLSGSAWLELSVSARHQKTRVLLCARRLVLLFVAAAVSDGVRYKFQNYKQ